ncbi:hypothetical protein [Saccharospirillum salsuginis]|uniref:Uncharacterized protein n=1 Tax=Saccharospirillum salsuginis TaxID=418750 RepID=A0A918KJR6_9GAMM|nr:hypothetical protein [Saccharospirillum salsuginis]GGX63820.1 hypothetical protein GCM10007392_34320 [Saccharospirillum salsuginis]
MNNIEWLDFIPSAMSAIAAVAAAVAAIVALNTSRKANTLSEKSLLAIHHNSTAIELSNAIEEVRRSTKDLSTISYNVWEKWAREIESEDNRSEGGLDPRPLRHVLTNGSEMLVDHGASRGQWYQRAMQSMFSIIRDGAGRLDEAEYRLLLKVADGTYGDFEGAFGTPPADKAITKSKAFKWVCYQLIKRVPSEAWHNSWRSAWLANGWIDQYRMEFKKTRPILEQTLSSLRKEKNKIEHSALPLEANPKLQRKYQKVLAELEVLVEDCDLDHMEPYQEWEYNEDISLLVIYSMAIAFLTTKVIDSIVSESEYINDF